MHYCVQLPFHGKLTCVSQGYANSLSQTGEGVGYSVVHFLLVEVLGRVRIGAERREVTEVLTLYNANGSISVCVLPYLCVYTRRECLFDTKPSVDLFGQF